MKTDDMNPFLDDLFAEARTEAPVHSFADTRKTLLAGLAIGGAGLLGAKFITSSIIKSKFFIMSISAVTILTSTVLVYTTGLKQTESVSETQQNNAMTYAITSPDPEELPDNLFIPAFPAEEVEPDDTTIVIKMDSVVDVQAIIDQVMQSINMEEMEGSIAEMMETISEMEISIDMGNFEEEMAELAESMEDFEMAEEDLAEIKVLMANFSQDSLKMEQLSNLAAQLELAGIQTATQAEQLALNGIYIAKSAPKASELKRKVFTITNKTTDIDLQDFNAIAIEAGMDIHYKCTVWAGKVKSLDMQLKVNNANSTQQTDIKIRKVKRNECFAYNIIWFEDSDGNAVKLSTSTEGKNNARLQNNRHNKTSYYNHDDCDNDCHDH